MKRSVKYLASGIAAFAAVSTTAVTVATEAIADLPMVQAYLEIESSKDVFHRLDMAEHQLALVEEMSEMACMVAHGIEVDDHLRMIRDVRSIFVRIRKGLMEGDEELGLYHEETHSGVIKALWEVDRHWDENYAPAIDHILTTGTLNDTDAYELFDHDEALIEALQKVVAEIQHYYAEPNEMMMSEAITLELLERQEFLIEAIDKDVCVIALGYHSDIHREALQKELKVFEATHSAVLNGMPAMGIKPAPTEEIRGRLEVFKTHFDANRDIIRRALDDEGIGDDELLEFEHNSIALMHEMEEIVKLYEHLKE